MRTVPPFADFAPLPLRSEDSAAREGDWLLLLVDAPGAPLRGRGPTLGEIGTNLRRSPLGPGVVSNYPSGSPAPIVQRPRTPPFQGGNGDSNSPGGTLGAW